MGKRGKQRRQAFQCKVAARRRKMNKAHAMNVEDDFEEGYEFVPLYDGSLQSEFDLIANLEESSQSDKISPTYRHEARGQSSEDELEIHEKHFSLDARVHEPFADISVSVELDGSDDHMSMIHELDSDESFKATSYSRPRDAGCKLQIQSSKPSDSDSDVEVIQFVPMMDSVYSEDEESESIMKEYGKKLFVSDEMGCFENSLPQLTLSDDVEDEGIEVVKGGDLSLSKTYEANDVLGACGTDTSKRGGEDGVVQCCEPGIPAKDGDTGACNLIKPSKLEEDGLSVEEYGGIRWLLDELEEPLPSSSDSAASCLARKTSTLMLILLVSVATGCFIGDRISLFHPGKSANSSNHSPQKSLKADEGMEALSIREEESIAFAHDKLWVEPNIQRPSLYRELDLLRQELSDMRLDYSTLRNEYRDLRAQFRVQKQVLWYWRRKANHVRDLQTPSIGTIDLGYVESVFDGKVETAEDRSILSSAEVSHMDFADNESISASSYDLLSMGESTDGKKQIIERLNNALNKEKQEKLIWQRKYARGRISNMQRCNSFGKFLPNASSYFSFSHCLDVISRSLPTIGISDLLKLNLKESLIQETVKATARKAVTGLDQLSDQVGNAWTSLKNGWKSIKFAQSEERKQHVRRSWQRFRKMFSYSNVISTPSSKDFFDFRHRWSPSDHVSDLEYPVPCPDVSSSSNRRQLKASANKSFSGPIPPPKWKSHYRVRAEKAPLSLSPQKCSSDKIGDVERLPEIIYPKTPVTSAEAYANMFDSSDSLKSNQLHADPGAFKSSKDILKDESSLLDERAKELQFLWMERNLKIKSFLVDLRKWQLEGELRRMMNRYQNQWHSFLSYRSAEEAALMVKREKFRANVKQAVKALEEKRARVLELEAKRLLKVAQWKRKVRKVLAKKWQQYYREKKNFIKWRNSQVAEAKRKAQKFTSKSPRFEEANKAGKKHYEKLPGQNLRIKANKGSKFFEGLRARIADKIRYVKNILAEASSKILEARIVSRDLLAQRENAEKVSPRGGLWEHSRPEEGHSRNVALDRSEAVWQAEERRVSAVHTVTGPCPFCVLCKREYAASDLSKSASQLSSEVPVLSYFLDGENSASAVQNFLSSNPLGSAGLSNDRYYDAEGSISKNSDRQDLLNSTANLDTHFAEEVPLEDEWNETPSVAWRGEDIDEYANKHPIGRGSDPFSWYLSWAEARRRTRERGWEDAASSHRSLSWYLSWMQDREDQRNREKVEKIGYHTDEENVNWLLRLMESREEDRRVRVPVNWYWLRNRYQDSHHDD